jgi:sugar diacid utilization regulator
MGEIPNSNSNEITIQQLNTGSCAETHPIVDTMKLPLPLNDIYKDYKLPNFDHDELKKLIKYQKDSELIVTLRSWVIDESTLPDK